MTEQLSDFNQPRLQGLKDFLLKNGCQLPPSLPDHFTLLEEVRALCPQLKKIQCHLNDFSSAEFQALCDALSLCSVLSLHLKYRNLKDLIKPRVIALCTALSHCIGLQGLALEGRGFDKLNDDCVKEFCEAFSCLSELRSLSWQGKDFETLEASRFGTIFYSFSPSKELRTLDLSTNDLDKLGLQHYQILRTAFSQWPRLQSVNLSNNYLGRLTSNHLNAGNPGRFKLLLKGLTHCTELQALYLNCNTFSESPTACFQEFCSWLCKSKRLQIVDLGSNYLRSDQLQVLYQALPACRELLSLNLMSSDFSASRTASAFESLKNVVLQCEILINLKLVDDKWPKAQFTLGENAILTGIFNQHKRFIRGIKPSLDNVLPSSKMPSSLKNLIIEYAVSPRIFSLDSKVNTLIGEEKTLLEEGLRFYQSAHCYEQGIGTDVNWDIALQFYQAALDSGYEPARQDLANLSLAHTALFKALSSMEAEGLLQKKHFASAPSTPQYNTFMPQYNASSRFNNQWLPFEYVPPNKKARKTKKSRKT